MPVTSDDLVHVVTKDKNFYYVEGIPSGREYQLPRRLKLTKAAVDGLPFQSSGQRMHVDTEIPGFYLVVGKSTKTYYVQKDINGGSRREKIGCHEPWTAEDARKQARIGLVQMDKGEDPAVRKRWAEWEAKAESVTLQRAWDDYKTTRALKPGTARQYEQLIKRVFEDWLTRPVRTLTRDMVTERHRRTKDKSGHPYADYAMRVLAAVLSDAAAQHQDPDGRSLIVENPVKVLSQRKAWEKAKRRESIICDDDLPQWFKTLDALRYRDEEPEAAVGCDYLEFVLFTGLRRNEAATLKWDDIDLTKKTVRVGDTKNGKPHLLPLTDPLITLLDRRRKEAAERQSPWVFPSPGRKNRDGCLAEPRYVADMVTKACGVKFTIHDLRRTFASIAGQKLAHYHLKRLMNHAMGGDVTGGYVVVNVDGLREGMQKITDHLMALKAKAQGMKVAQAS